MDDFFLILVALVSGFSIWFGLVKRVSSPSSNLLPNPVVKNRFLDRLISDLTSASYHLQLVEEPPERKGVVQLQGVVCERMSCVEFIHYIDLLLPLTSAGKYIRRNHSYTWERVLGADEAVEYVLICVSVPLQNGLWDGIRCRSEKWPLTSQEPLEYANWRGSLEQEVFLNEHPPWYFSG